MPLTGKPTPRAQRLREPNSLAASANRIWGMILRYWYVIRSSWPRTAELIYWPLVQMLMWGFLQSYLATASNFAAKAAGLFIGAVLLWDILVRSQLGFAVAFLEDIWSRNLGHLMMSPLRPVELVVALMAVSFIKLMVAMVPVALLAYTFFGFNVLSLGLAFAAFFANLVLTSWSLGLVSTGVVLRWGLGAESFAWLIVFVLLPVCCVYYPVATLPAWLQPVSLALPPTYVFEGLRAIVLEGRFVTVLMLKAVALNVVYFALGFAAFAYFLQSARRHGTLVQMGE
ncbi:MAG TPA: ABC transporter permease [Hyphomicrobiaceae bacterium]|nr:ABC transporter permease [Hyphomicrobiaceae bacterium]